MASQDHPTTSLTDNAPFTVERDSPKMSIHHAKIIDEDGRIAALFSAIEVLTWQLVNSGVLTAEPLADELMRYAKFHSSGEKSLLLLARLARAAIPSKAEC